MRAQGQRDRDGERERARVTERGERERKRRKQADRQRGRGCHWNQKAPFSLNSSVCHLPMQANADEDDGWRVFGSSYQTMFSLLGLNIEFSCNSTIYKTVTSFTISSL